MVYLELTAHPAEVCRKVELLREILHPVVLMGSQHHLQFLGIDLAVLVHHEVCRTGCLEVETVVCAVCVSDPEKMTEFMGAFLLESMTVIALTDRCDTGMCTRPVQGQGFRLERLQEPPAPPPEGTVHVTACDA